MPKPSSPSSDPLARSMRGPSASSSSSHGASKANSLPPAPPSPSASILLISPTNRILLLHRVTTSRSFASAHVFPGGHVSPSQDGALPPISSPSCHEDSLPYRMAAIRECFEESGLLLAHDKRTSQEDGFGEAKKKLLGIEEREREEGRRAVHANRVCFRTWVENRGGQIDVEGLVPFTRWLTPANIERRFSTQMYLYFLPLGEEAAAATAAAAADVSSSGSGSRSRGEESRDVVSKKEEEDVHIPTPDGGIEHTAASFLYPSEWLARSLEGEVLLFPPQFFLLSLLAEYLAPPAPPSSGRVVHGLDRATVWQQQQRERLMNFVTEDGDPPWGEKCISPDTVKVDGRGAVIMGLARPGPELEGTGRAGDRERVIRIGLDEERERGRQRPRPREVIWRRDLESGKL